MKRLLFFIVVCCTSTACFKPLPPLWEYKLKTFVSGYRCLGEVIMSKNGDYLLVFKDNSIESETLLEEDCRDNYSEYHEKLKELAIIHNDELEDYQSISRFGVLFEPPRIFLYPDFSSIHIEGDIDGTNVSLDDVTTVYSVSCKGYIDSGYKYEYDWSGRFSKDGESDVCKEIFEIPDNGLGYLYPVVGIASKMDLDDLMLLGRDQSKDIPENADGKTYPFMALKINKDAVSKITVTLRGTDGNSYVGTLELK